MWELILKADYNFIYEDSLSMGFWNPAEKSITLNLWGIAKKASIKNRDDFRNFKDFKLTAENMANDRRIINEILAVVNHEVMHEAMHEPIEQRIREITEEWIDEGIEVGAYPEEVRDNKEFKENMFDLQKNINYMLLQEFAVRWVNGESFQNILMELEGYIDKIFVKMRDQMIELTISSLSGEINEDEVKNAGNQVLHIANKMRDFIGSRLIHTVNDIQGKMDYLIGRLDLQDKVEINE